MTDTPLNPDAEVSKDQTIFAYEAAERDYPQHGSIMLKLHHSNFQSSLWQVSKRTAESLRDQLNDLLAVAQPEVNSGKAEAWEEGWSTGWGDAWDNAKTISTKVTTSNNPYKETE